MPVRDDRTQVTARMPRGARHHLTVYGQPAGAVTSGAPGSVSDAWTVPADQPSGWLEVGSAGCQVDWRRGARSDDGTFTVVGHGTMQAAMGSAAFAHG